jgi:hypothetical protein
MVWMQRLIVYLKLCSCHFSAFLVLKILTVLIVKLLFMTITGQLICYLMNLVKSDGLNTNAQSVGLK